MTHRTLPFLLSLCSCLFISSAGSEETPRNGVVAVESFGARGDATTDDSEAFQAALDSVSAVGGGVVLIPTGKFLIKRHLTIPRNVTLEGVWRAPQAGQPYDGGTTLLAVEGKGDSEGTPFITLNTGSTLSGVTIFYPEQVIADPPHPYPWTIRSGVVGAVGQGSIDNPAIINVTIINPYQAVDFGSVPTGRHKIDGLYAHALKKGVYIDQCYDVGRISNVHFWPFFDLNPESPLWKFTKREGTSFIIGRTDGEMATNCFSIFYRVGMHFINGIG
ncbi:MAG: hypothetical protein HUU16_13955, partial [Candidatus Omnitrophica bacterium]|nr:hypothetical protein [Candidatus Omnitrophota bacterium]